MSKVIKIGTRKSELAQWQAKEVLNQLKAKGIEAELVLIDSEGDTNQVVPLYEMGVVGVFTRSLDIALLNNKIDIAVHSMKDVPVVLPEGISQFAVLERATTKDILVRNHANGQSKMIATSSLRRKSQWLNKYPDYKVEEIRGNVNTRLRKVAESNWEGAVFAAAGLERINLLPESYEVLDWMIPAPAQGAIMIVGRTVDTEVFNEVNKLNNFSTCQCVTIERQILRNLAGGCTAPIAVLITELESTFQVKAGIYSLDGSRKVEIEEYFPLERVDNIADICTELLLKNGGEDILKEIKAFTASVKK